MRHDRPVIVRDAGDAWQVVMQTDHADLSGAIATAWADRGPRHDSVVVAARRHDDGWAVWERSPLVDHTGQAGLVPRREGAGPPRFLSGRDRRHHGRRPVRRAPRVDARRRDLPAALRRGSRPATQPGGRGGGSGRRVRRRAGVVVRGARRGDRRPRRAALGGLPSAAGLRPAVAPVLPARPHDERPVHDRRPADRADRPVGDPRRPVPARIGDDPQPAAPAGAEALLDAGGLPRGAARDCRSSTSRSAIAP